jgi:hypothetical protein
MGNEANGQRFLILVGGLRGEGALKQALELLESVKMRMRREKYENISKSFKYTIFSY